MFLCKTMGPGIYVAVIWMIKLPKTDKIKPLLPTALHWLYCIVPVAPTELDLGETDP